MAVAVTVDLPGGTEQQYEQITKLFPDGKLAEDWLVHLAGPTGNGWRVVNVVPPRSSSTHSPASSSAPPSDKQGKGT